MASKRGIKRELRKIVEDVLEECYEVQQFNPKKHDESEKLIDEAVDFYDTMVVEIKNGKSKKDARQSIQKIEEAAEDYVRKMNALQG